MNANELRIGNLVSRLDLGDHSLRVESVLELRKDKVLTTGPISVICLYSETKPIPLTEEWLLTFGFIKYGHILKIHLNEGLGVNYNKDLKIWYLDIHFTTTAKIQINYVHQLQNLYFALIGDELTIKPD